MAKKTTNKNLDENFFAKFGPVKIYKKDQLIVEPEKEPAGVFYLKKGFARLYTISKEGKEITFNIYKPGMYFPLIWALNQNINIYFIEALTDVEVLKAPKEEVIKTLQQNPDLLFLLTQNAFSGLEGITKLMDSLLSKNAYHQISSILVMLTVRFGKPDGKQTLIEVPLTHRVLGTLAGLSREATSRELEKLVKEKIITYSDHKITILNYKKLQEEFISNSSEHINF